MTLSRPSDDQRLRPVQDRRRSVVLAYGRADEGGGRFRRRARRSGAIARVASVEVTLFGSLAFTGRGHATDRAVVLGLMRPEPETLDPDAADALVASVAQDEPPAAWRAAVDRLRPGAGDRLRRHRPAAAPSQYASPRRARRGRRVLADETWLSVGGGFILRDGAAGGGAARRPFPILSGRGAELLARAREAGLTIADLVRANEAALSPAEAVEDAARTQILSVMFGASTAGSRQRAACPAACGSNAGRGAIYRRPDRGGAAQRPAGARGHGFRQRLRDGGQRGERRRRPRRHRADQRRGRRRSGDAPLLPRPLRRRDARGAFATS